MGRDEFKVVVKAFITSGGDVMIGQKEDGEKVHSGKWHFIGGHLDKGEQMEEAVKREVKEETGLDVKVHQLIDSMTFGWEDSDENNALMALYHCESSSKDAEPQDDLQDVKWIKPENLKEELWDEEADRIKERDRWSNFIEKLKKMPAF